MTSALLDRLNPQQREAVVFCDGPELVIAGAGSGKTRVLTRKIAYLIQEKHVAPNRILAVTFTNKAASEMKSRVEALLGGAQKDMQVSTFHSFGVRLMCRYRNRLGELGLKGDFVVFDRSDLRALVKRLMQELNIDAKRFDVSWVMEKFSRAKTEADPKTLEPVGLEPMWRPLYDRLQQELHSQGGCDFDDLLAIPLHLLYTHEDIAEAERNALDWILVDEYQDVNRPQYLMLRKLVNKERHIMVVGDPDQSIYRWRGADMTMILNFERDFPGAKVVVLEQNYRSTATILNGANAVIRNNPDRHPKDLWTAKERGMPIHVLLAQNQRDEAHFIAKEIESLHEDGYRFGEIAVLYRINAMSRTYEQALLESGIPYRVVRGVAFYERREVKDILSYLRAAVNPMDRSSLMRIGNVPGRGLGKKSLEVLSEHLSSMGEIPAVEAWKKVASGDLPLKGKALKAAEDLGRTMVSILEREDDLSGIIRFLLDEVGYAEYLREEEPENWEERVENVFELLSVIPSEGSLPQMLAEVALVTDLEAQQEDPERVNLLTLHAAKGLEYPVVFLVGMEEAIFPYAKALEDPEGIGEERRLCYVGMTRAQERLYLTAARDRLLFGTVHRSGFSRFLWEIPDEFKKVDDRTREEEEFDYARRGTYRRRWGW